MRRSWNGLEDWNWFSQRHHPKPHSSISLRGYSATPQLSGPEKHVNEGQTEATQKYRLLCVSPKWFCWVFPPHIQNIFHFRLIALSESWARSPSFHPNQERSRAEAVSEELVSPVGESRAHPAPEVTVTCPGSLQRPAQHHSANDSSLNPFMERPSAAPLGVCSPALPKELSSQREAGMCLPWAKWKTKGVCLLFTQLYKWESWLCWISNYCAR